MAGPKKERKPTPVAVRGYLVLYNLLSAAGWAYNLVVVLQSLLAGETAAQAWKKSGPILVWVQTAAALEILHSLLRFVSSPVFTTVVQVASRLIVLWGFTYPTSYQHWSFWLIAISWSTVEVPRYLFYVWQLLFPDTPAPYALFWLRYSLFAVLYPTGITGEILQLWNSLAYWKTSCNAFRLFSYFVLFVAYPPGSPFMYFHMVGQRKQQFKKRAEAGKPAAAAAPAAPAEGLLFPIDPQTNDASTLSAGKRVFAHSVRSISPSTAENVMNERNWRFGYSKHVLENVRISSVNKEQSVAIAHAGLDFCYKQFRFVRNGKESSLEDALIQYSGTFLEGKLVGRKAPNKDGVSIQYKQQKLQGPALKAQLDKWVEYGTIEPSSRDALLWASENVKDLSDKYFVLLGAGSAMGPLQFLLSLNANIIAVDLDRPGIWERVLNLVNDSASTVYFPVKSQPKSSSIQDLAQVAGCNLFTQTPEIARWISELLPGKQFIIGTYVYLDSAAHVQVSLAADAVVSTAIAKRGVENVIPAYLCSPTDTFTVNRDTYEAAVKNRKNAPLWQKLIAAIAPKLLRPNGVKTEDGHYIVNGIVVNQGPNYALAKRIQHWRAILASSRGAMVSSNIAPSTATASVVHNKSFAAAYEGMKYFKPMEVMQQETSNTVMGALLVSDVCNVANSPKNPTVGQGAAVAQNPVMLFAPGAMHGGVWRIGFDMNSIGPISAAIYYLGHYSPYILAGIGAIVGVATVGLPFELP